VRTLLLLLLTASASTVRCSLPRAALAAQQQIARSKHDPWDHTTPVIVPCRTVPFFSSICTVSFDSFIKNLQHIAHATWSNQATLPLLAHDPKACKLMTRMKQARPTHLTSFTILSTVVAAQLLLLLTGCAVLPGGKPPGAAVTRRSVLKRINYATLVDDARAKLTPTVIWPLSEFLSTSKQALNTGAKKTELRRRLSKHSGIRLPIRLQLTMTRCIPQQG
jgi:hypothetical protein